MEIICAGIISPGGIGLDFETLYQQYLEPIWRYVRCRVPSHADAQDLVGEVFVRALRSWSRFDPGRGTASAWIFTIAQRSVTDWRRRQSHRPLLSSFDEDWSSLAGVTADPQPDRQPERALLAQEQLSELRTGLASLTDREREALALRFGGRLKAAEVARVLGLSEGAVKMMIHRPILKLKAVMLHDRG